MDNDLIKQLTIMKQLNNSCLSLKLFERSNISLLEEILNKDSQELERLKNLKRQGKLNFGPIVKESELEELFTSLKDEVDNFLGVLDINAPKIEYCSRFNFFRPELFNKNTCISYAIAGSFLFFPLNWLLRNNTHTSLNSFFIMSTLAFIPTCHMLNTLRYNVDHYISETNSMHLFKNSKANLLPTMGHEYAHHIQRKILFAGVHDFEKNYSIFSEGISRGVQRHVSKIFKEKEDNEAFLYEILNYNVEEMKRLYPIMCYAFGIEPQQSLLKAKNFIEKHYFENNEPNRYLANDYHAIGNSLFYVLEIKFGSSIYKDAIKGDVSFLEK